MSDALDLTRTPRLNRTQQDVALPTFAPMPSGCRWFVVASKPNAERRAHAALHLKGYRPYLPLVTIRRPNRHYRTVPLFPGYLFIQLDLAHPWYPIRSAPGVFQLLTIEGIPQPCRAGAVEALQADDALRATPIPPSLFLASGTPVAVSSGILRGHHAIVIASTDQTAIIQLIMFGELRDVAVDVECLRMRDE